MARPGPFCPTGPTQPFHFPFSIAMIRRTRTAANGHERSRTPTNAKKHLFALALHCRLRTRTVAHGRLSPAPCLRLCSLRLLLLKLMTKKIPPCKRPDLVQSSAIYRNVAPQNLPRCGEHALKSPTLRSPTSIQPPKLAIAAGNKFRAYARACVSDYGEVETHARA